MKTKNLLMMALSLCLIAVIAVGGTLAYFTANADLKENVFTTGKVDITLVDEGFKPTGSTETWVQEKDPTASGGVAYSNVMPGHTIGKRVAVDLGKGSENCYVAMKVELSSTVADLDMNDIVTQICTTAEGNGWTTIYDDDADANTIIFYNKTALSEDNSRALLFETFQVPTAWGNDVVNNSFSIKVSASAVQQAALDAPAYGEDGKPNDALAELLKPFTETDSSEGDLVQLEEPVTGNE